MKARVRVRLCYAGHQESVVGIADEINPYFSGFHAERGFALRHWHYEYEGVKKIHDTDLFIPWESVFVIEVLRDLEPKPKEITVKGGTQ